MKAGNADPSHPPHGPQELPPAYQASGLNDLRSARRPILGRLAVALLTGSLAAGGLLLDRMSHSRALAETQPAGLITQPASTRPTSTRSAATQPAGADATASATARPAATQPVATQPAERPLLTAQQYADLAAELREAYSLPPDQWPAPEIDPGVEFVELGRLGEVPFPADNPFSEAKAELGKQLFFDPRLSGSRQIACASCHDPDLAWADGRVVSFGHDRQQVQRNAPSLLNSGFNTHQFWDGRAKSLEDQVVFPVIAENEMHAEPDKIVERLNALPGYREQFKAVFGNEQVTMENVAKAIATFERTLVGGRSRFDAFLSGRKHMLSDEAIRGLHLFRTTARCINCHHGPNFTDNQFHDLGLSYYGRKYEDLGRYNVTKNPEDVGRFKTPSLRNVTRTAPYMHNGLFDLIGVLRMYNAGMATLRRKPEQENDPLFPTKSHLLRPLGLNEQDLADLEAFLESLAEPRRRIRPPELPQ